MSQPTKNNFVFILGREQEIALAELKAVFSRFDFCFDIYKITANVVFANIDNFTTNDANKVMDALAGTIKIYKLEGPVDKDIASQIVLIFRAHKTNSEGKINFGISYFGRGFSRQNINSIALTAKKQLKGDFSLRYVESKDSAELSSILTLKNNLATKGIEFGLFDDAIGILVAFNNPESWSERDYDKPAFDKYSGMLPPKLARMMINLALGQIRITNKELRIMDNKVVSDHDSKFMIHDSQRPLVVDPFCGSGNILMEAMMLGCDVAGSDISAKAVADSEKNCQWLLEQMAKKQEIRNKQISYDKSQIPKVTVFKADATSDSLIENCKLKIENYDRVAIICEPYLGEPKKFKPSLNAAKGEYTKVKELYLSFLKNIAILLNCYIAVGTKNNTTIRQYNNCILCVVFPLVETVEGKRYSLFMDSVDEIRELGYTQVCPTMTYGRDYQIVKREIILLKPEK